MPIAVRRAYPCLVFQRLIEQARTLYLGGSYGIELENTTYALNSMTIDLCLSLFPWTLFRTTTLSLIGCMGVLP